MDEPGHDDPALFGYSSNMTVDDIEKAVAKLPPEQLAEFRAWFERFDFRTLR